MPDLHQRLQSTLGPSYVVERELGGGGMSRVFVALDQSLGRQVVVKVLPPEMAGAMSLDRFRREIQVAARLQHPHVVPLLSAGQSGDLLYFTMPFVTGESLRTRLVRGELPVPEAVRVLREIADALAYAHKQGVVHRDIKPENVLLSEGHALVTDFGVAKAVSTAAGEAGATSVGIAVGTPAYMAPEQATADPTADHRVDIYAFGVLAYELLVGEPPFRGRSAQELVAAHMTQPAEPVSRRRPAIPEALGALVMKCLEKRAADRPQTAGELVHVLDAAVTPGGHVPGYSSGTGVPAKAGARARGRWLVAAAAIALAAGVFAWWSARTPMAEIDERLIVVLPFRVAGADPSLHYLREGMVDLLAAKLTGETRVADPRAALAAWRAEGGSATADVDAEAAAKVAARLGAGEVLLGDITGTGSQVVLRASLIPVGGGEPEAAIVEGPQDSIAVLVDRLAANLLALRSGEDLRKIGSIAATPLPAIRSYLEGRALGRRGQYEEALVQFRTAVRADSNFAAAWVGMYDMLVWLSEPTDSVARHIVRLREQLTPATRAVIDAQIGPEHPRLPDVAETLRLAEAATAVAPDNPAAWQFLGEVFYHWAPAIGVPGAEARAIGAFERALALDSTYAAALEHLPDLHLRRGDTARVRGAVEARLALDSTSSFAAYALYLADEGLGDERRGTQWRRLVADHPGDLANLMLAGTLLGFPLAPVDTALTAQLDRAVTDAERVGTLEVLSWLAVVSGQPARAARLTRELLELATRSGNARAIGDAAAYAILIGLYADGDTALAADARRTLGPHLAAEMRPGRHNDWIVAGLYDLAHGSTATARRAIAFARAQAPGTCTPQVPTLCADLARILDAQLAAVERRPDARQRLVELDSMLRDSPVRTGMLLHLGNLVAARLWEDAGDDARALAALRRRPWFNSSNTMFATYLREEARLAAATGDTDAALATYRHYLALRQDAEPALASHLASVRRDVARLERRQAR